MADFVIRPVGETDWGNALFLSGNLPLNAVDASALGIDMGTDYEIGRLGALATFQVSDVPGTMVAPILVPDTNQVTVTLPDSPADNGQPITGYDLRHRTDGGSWTLVNDINDPVVLTGLPDETLIEVAVRALNVNGAGAWSPEASTTTTTAAVAPIISGVPTITGTARVGETLSVTAATVSGNPAPTRTWQWLRDDAAISGATSDSYTQVVADEGAALSVRQTETNSEGSDSAVSAATSSVIHIAPAAAGGLADLTLTEDVAMAAVDVSGDFTGEDLTFTLAASSDALPAGLSLSTAGILSGTPGAIASGLSIIARGTNSGGFADSAFSLGVSAPTGDTTAPVVNSISLSGTEINVDLTETSGAATAVWATSEPATDPTFTVGGGWSGSVYETGSFTATSGGDTDTISLTETTPPGAQEMSLYFYDAAGNLSTVERLAFTQDNPSAGGDGIGTPTRLLATPYTDSAEAGTTHTTANVTPSGDAPLVIVVHAQNGSTGAMSVSSATFGGVNLTPEIVQQESRVHTMIFVVENPSAAAANFSLTLAEVPRSLVIEILEVPGAATSATLGAQMTGAGDNDTSAAVTGNTGTDGSLVLHAISRRYTGEPITASGADGALSQQTSGGTAQFRDVDTLIAWEIVDPAGPGSIVFDWATSEQHAATGIELRAS